MPDVNITPMRYHRFESVFHREEFLYEKGKVDLDIVLLPSFNETRKLDEQDSEKLAIGSRFHWIGLVVLRPRLWRPSHGSGDPSEVNHISWKIPKSAGFFFREFLLGRLADFSGTVANLN